MLILDDFRERHLPDDGRISSAMIVGSPAIIVSTVSSRHMIAFVLRGSAILVRDNGNLAYCLVPKNENVALLILDLSPVNSPN